MDTPSSENKAAHERLVKVLSAHGIRFVSGMSRSDDGTGGEESLLAFIGPARAVELGRDFGQNAIVAGRAGESAGLRWTNVRR